jgi:hypothetical protein
MRLKDAHIPKWTTGHARNATAKSPLSVAFLILLKAKSILS